MELVVAEVKRGVDGLERLKVKVDLLLLAFVCEDGATVDNKTVRWHFAVKFETLLSGGDGRQD